VFYFFERRCQFVSVELAGDHKTGYHITITDHDGHERTERFPSSDALLARWAELQQTFEQSGWWGPAGRD
jgi:hypothetical protein